MVRLPAASRPPLQPWSLASEKKKTVDKNVGKYSTLWFEIRGNLNYLKFGDLIVRQQQAELLSKVVLALQPCSGAKQPFQLEIMTNELVKAGSMNTYTARAFASAGAAGCSERRS